MHIQHTQIGLQSQHTRTHLDTSRERLELWAGTRGTTARTRAAAAPTPAALPTPRPPTPPAPGVDKPERTQNRRDTLEPRLQTLVRMIEAITGMPVRLGQLDDTGHAAEASPTAPGPTDQPTAAAPAGWGLVYERDTTRIDTEQLAIQAQGRVVTADGTEISFELNVQMQTTRISTSSTTLRAGDAVLKDPLVVHFDGPLGELRDARFTFDLDADGHTEAMPFVGQGSGFLVLDRNANGRVDDGRELFGALSGNGFADLAAFDDDGNGWIDEADAVFEQLQVWRMDAAGTTRLQNLSSAGVGAVHLTPVTTDMALHASPDGPQLGQARSTGVYLSHTGQAGWVQQVDLVV